MTEEELKNMLEHMHKQTRRIQAKAALAATTAQTSQRTKSTPSIIDAIRKGQMKEIAPKKFCNVQVSGNFKSWAKDMKEFIFWHDKDTKELIENFEAHWKMDERMKYADIKRCCADNGMEVEIDKALHMILGAFLEGTSKVLSETAELSNPDNLEMHKSGLELWRLLKYNFDRSSAFNVITILESIRSMQPAKNIQDVLPKITVLERSHQEYARQAVASKDPEFVKMRGSGVGMYPEVFKKADLLKVLPESIVKELKKSTNIDFEHDTYKQIRDTVTTIVHNHTKTASPMDIVKKYVRSVDQHEPDTNKKDEEAQQEDMYPVYDEEGGLLYYIVKEGSWHAKGKGKGKGKFEGVCYNCGKIGHRSQECRAKGKGKSDIAEDISKHSFTIQARDVAKYGAYPGCPGCKFILGEVATQCGNNKECKSRMMAAMEADKDNKHGVRRWYASKGIDEDAKQEEDGEKMGNEQDEKSEGDAVEGKAGNSEEQAKRRKDATTEVDHKRKQTGGDDRKPKRAKIDASRPRRGAERRQGRQRLPFGKSGQEHEGQLSRGGRQQGHVGASPIGCHASLRGGSDWT